MKTDSPRWVTLVAALCATLVALPPVSAMDILERVVTTQTQSIRHEATEYQRKVAEAHARAYVAAHASSETKTTKTGKTGSTTAKTKTKTEPEKTHTAKAKLPRYIAVDTVKDKRSAPSAKKVVMIWDTQSESFADKNVYDVTTPPAVGTTAKFDTYSAQYVGTGF